MEETKSKTKKLSAKKSKKPTESVTSESKEVPIIKPIIKSRNYSENFVNGLIFIFVGAVLFLNTTGVIPWSIWNHVWRFWPIFLILLGLQLILGSSKIAGFLIGIFTFFLLVAIFGTATLLSGSSYLGSRLQERLDNWTGNEAEISSQIEIKNSEYEDLGRVDYKFDIGAGEFNLNDKSSEILQIDANYFENFGKPVLTQDHERGNLEIGFKQESNRHLFLPGNNLIYDVELTDKYDDGKLEINLGAGSGKVEFENVAFEKINADVGAGKLLINLEENATPETIDLNVGTGKIILTLSENVGYTLKYAVGVGDLKVEGKSFGGLGKNDDEYKSENYDRADKTVDIIINVGVGSIEIK